MCTFWSLNHWIELSYYDACHWLCGNVQPYASEINRDAAKVIGRGSPLQSMECISSAGSFLVIPQSQPGALQIHWGLCGWIARASAVWTVTPRTNYTARGTGPLRRWAMVASQGRKMTIPWKGHTRHSCPPIQAYSQSDNLNSNHDIPSPPHTQKKIIFIPCQNGRLTFSISALSRVVT